MHTRGGLGETNVAGGFERMEISARNHSVQFYEDHAVFLDRLAEFAGSALGTGGACVVIATEEHRRGLAERLKACFIDLQQAARTGRYIALDAAETLAGFMVAGRPDRERFQRAIEPVLLRAKAAASGNAGTVAAFGEMVALLWDGGGYEEALQLEQLWNELTSRHAFSLLCAYPLSCFAHESQYDLFRRVCEEHTRVVPAEGYTLLGCEAERTRLISSLQQKAALVRSAVEERERAIAQRQHAEEKLWHSEEFARKVVENCIDCVQVLDGQGRLEYMSPSGQTAFEIPEMSGHLGRSWVGFWKEDDRPRVQAALAEARSGGVGSFQADSTSSNGNRKYWDVRITPARERDGEVRRLIAIARDMTELRRAQQMALQAEKVAAAGRMAATIAHEINNPLEAVTNFLYLARTTAGLPEEVSRHLEIADRELTRVAQIAQRTLGFYRDTSKNKWMNVAEAVDDVLLVYERKLRFKHLRTKKEIAEGLKVFAKQGEVKQVLSNLVANAIDASREGGALLVRAHASSNWNNGGEPGIRITVADEGAGMAPEVQKKIFVPFFTTKANVGTGIGLWVTKSLIEQQGGYLRFRSRQGKRSGTVMSFFLPAAPRAQTLEMAA